MGIFDFLSGEFIDVIPPQQRIDDKWYQGTADAVYQNIYALEQGQSFNVPERKRTYHLRCHPRLRAIVNR